MELHQFAFDLIVAAADNGLLIEKRLRFEACRQPPYLKVIFEEVKLWRFFAEPP